YLSMFSGIILAHTLDKLGLQSPDDIPSEALDSVVNAKQGCDIRAC
ncbi:MAG: hypothetical protein HQK54_15440, partial [Oligoflexales bacterium]|nr:hypothetical protein [Oligoflexales bacterium]